MPRQSGDAELAAEQLAAAAAAGPGGAGPGPLDPAGVAAGAGGDAGVHGLLGSRVAGFALVEAYGAAKTTACKYCSAPLLPPGVAESPAPEGGGAGQTVRSDECGAGHTARPGA